MDVAPALPPDLVTFTAPLGRGPPELARPPRARDPDGSPAVAPFDLLLQLLGAGLPVGQTLPAGGSDSPGSDPLTCSTAPAVAATPTASAPPTTGAASAPAQPQPTDLVDLLRLALARAAASPTPAPLDSSVAADAASSAAPPANAPAASPTAPAQMQASSDSAPIDLQALLGGAEQSSAPPIAVLDNAPRARAGADAPRRPSAGVTSVARAAELAASELANTDTSAQRAPETPTAVIAPEGAVGAAKAARLDDALALAVPATASADASPTPSPLPLAHASTPAPATSAAPAQSATPQSFGEAVDTTSTRWHDALATRIQWLVDHDLGEAKIKLNPPELGALDVKISLLDDKTFVQMTAHNANARDELAQGLPRLRELLSAGGLELGGATVSGGRDERGAFGSTPQPVMRAAPFAALAEALPDGLRPRLGSSLAVIDTFA